MENKTHCRQDTDALAHSASTIEQRGWGQVFVIGICRKILRVDDVAGLLLGQWGD